MAVMLSPVVLALHLTAWPAAARDAAPVHGADPALGALGADDECQVADGGKCSLSVMQLQRRRLSQGRGGGASEILDHVASGKWGRRRRKQQQRGGADGDAPAHAEPGGDAKGAEPAKGEPEKAEEAPGHKGGEISRETHGSTDPATGGRNSAMDPRRAGPFEQCSGVHWTGATECVEGYTCHHKHEYYGQCKPSSDTKARPYEQCSGLLHTGSKECVDGYLCFNETDHYGQCRPAQLVDTTWNEYVGSSTLSKPSEAPLLTFYMYRAVDHSRRPPPNSDTASLGGVLYYLHTDVVSCKHCMRARFHNIDRIVRYRVRTRATQPLFKLGLNFGLWLSFDRGQCTGPGECDRHFAKYGYYVGCNNLSSSFPDQGAPASYAGAWYSLPGECTADMRNFKGIECKRGQPGGFCETPVTGVGTCTYTFMEAGEIYMNDLVGITNYEAFRQAGGQEYNPDTDRGVNATFWDGLRDPEANAERIMTLDNMFKEKYPNLPSDLEQPAPQCDFDMARSGQTFLAEEKTTAEMEDGSLNDTSK